MGEMNTDIPKSIVMALIVVTLIVSILGSWMVSERLGADSAETEDIGGSNSGNVGFKIMSEEKPNMGESTANVGLNKIK